MLPVLFLLWASVFVEYNFVETQKYENLVLDQDIRLSRPWPDLDGGYLPFKTVSEVEEFLKTAKVIDAKPIGIGITGAQKVLLEKDGIRMNAAFRDVAENHKILTMADGTRIINFRDDAIFECAAYELSKILGIHFVPPTVRRAVRGKRGTLQAWIEDCMMEAERIKKKESPPVPREWLIQQHVMYLFDNLIFNFDRNAGNLLVTPDWKIVLIDHTRSFTRDRRLHRPERVLFCEKDVLARLRELDKDILKEKIGPFVGPPLIDALLARRDLMVERLDKLIEERGENVVLLDLWL